MDPRHLIQRLKPDDTFFLAFFANCPIGLNLCRIDGKWVQSNPAFLNIIGYTADEADNGNLTYWQLTPPEYADAENIQLKNLNEKGSYGPYSKEFIRKDGKRIPVRLNGFLIERDGEKFIWSMIEDLSAQTNLREELQQSERFYQAILDSLPVAVFAKDSRKDWTFVLWNKFAQESLGLTKESVLGKTDHDLFPKAKADYYRKTDENTLLGHEAMKNHVESLLLPGREEIWLESTKVPFNDALGNPRYILGVTQDISQRIKSENTLKLAMETARNATQAKSEFLSNMSHEIRTPLHAMLGVGELLAKTNLTEDQKKYLQILAKSGARLLDVVNDILDLERIESGQMNIRRRPEQLNAVLHSAYDLMLIPAQHAKLKFHQNIQVPDDVVVLTDAGALHQILTNIIGNSIKFTPALGSIELHASWIPDQKNKTGQMTVTIRDTGIGIAKKNQSRIFEPFQQGDSSVGKKYGGSGLGLTIVDKLVNKLSGKIDLKSELGQGTTLTLNFPMEIASIEKIKSSQSDAKEKKSKPPAKLKATTKAKILVVDDSPENQLLACEILRSHNYDVIVANDGFEALSEFESSHPALVLLDIGMPIMDGYETVSQIRRRELELNWRPTPIVALTGYALKTDIARAAAAGFDRHLSKPFGMMQLLNLVEELLQKDD